jgi:hypothetical protein
MEKHGYTDECSDAEDWRYWEASWELMDIAEAHWDQAVVSTLNQVARRRTKRNSGQKSAHSRKSKRVQ